MEVVVIGLLIVIVGMLAFVLVALMRDSATDNGDSSLPVPSGAGIEPTSAGMADDPLVDVVRLPDGGFQVRERISGETMLDVHPVSMPDRSRPNRGHSTVPANATFLSGLSGIGIDVTKSLRAGTEYTVKFTPKVQKMLDKGTARLMQTSRGPVSDAVSRSTGRIVEHGTVVESAVVSPTQVLASGLTAGAAAAQLYQIQAALDRIEKRLEELIGRVRDDDHGELSAAEALVAPLLAAAINGRVPPQLAAELAVHRQRVDSIFFSRQRFIERFRDELEARQDRHSDKREEPRAWARGTTKAFGDRETFEAEVLIYARAMSIRARLTMCSAAVVSLDGQPEVAQWMLRDVAEDTADAFGDLARRLGALGREDIGWTWVPMSGRKELQETAQAMAELLETQIAPQLPPRPSDTFEFNLQVSPESFPDSSE
jgi:hypothetical protein